MAEKPTNPVQKTENSDTKPTSITDIKPGQLNAYNTLDNHIILNQATYDKFVDVVTEVVYRNTEPDQMSGMAGPFQGIVLRVVSSDSKDIKFDFSSVVNQLVFGRPAKLLQLKVRIPELHAGIPVPTDKDLAAEKAATGKAGTKGSSVDFYPTFTAQNEEVSKKIPSVGELVWVTFENIPQQKRGIYLGPVVNSKGVAVVGDIPQEPINENEQKAQENAGGIPNFTYKTKLEQYPGKPHPKGQLAYAMGSGSPMVLGIQSALGVPVTGVLDSTTMNKLQEMGIKEQITSAEFISWFGPKFPIWVRTSEYTQNNESGGHRQSPGIPINYWSGRTPVENRNVVYGDGAGNNYGILGFNISNFPNFKALRYPYATIFSIKDTSTAEEKRPTIQILDWRKADLTPLDSRLTGGSSLAKLFVYYADSTGKEVWKRNRLEVYAQKLIHGQAWVWIGSNNKNLTNTSYTKNEKNSIVGMLKNLVDKEVHPIPEIENWLNSVQGVQAQTMYYLEKIFYNAIKFALDFEYSVPVIAAAADITAGGEPSGTGGGLKSAIGGVKDLKERRVAWIQYVDGTNAFGNGKIPRHMTAALGSVGNVHGTMANMADYGLTDEYTNRVQGELEFWKSYVQKRKQNKLEARKMLKQYLSNLFAWDLSHIPDTDKYE